MYFDECTTLDELKAVYRKLAIQYHPDRGGDVRIMQAINAEHDRRFEQLKRAHNEQAAAPDSTVRATTETPEEFRQIVEALLQIDGINVELCGSWLWIDGNTYEHKSELKAAGCRWSRSKQKWYWRHAEDGARWSRGRVTMEGIREKYGSAYLKQTNELVRA